MLSGPGALEPQVYKIPNSKHQTTNKSQIPISNDQNRFGIGNFGYCCLFEICDLRFGISSYSGRRSQTGKAGEAPFGQFEVRFFGLEFFTEQGENG
jgi:hypothetical protein